MKIAIYSDLHSEHYGNLNFLKTYGLLENEADVCVLAGDIGCTYVAKHLYTNLIAQMCNFYPQVIMVPGNHEYIHYNHSRIQEFLIEMEAQRVNFKALLDETFEYGGERFIGNTMWYTRQPDTSFGLERDWIDFNSIKASEIYAKSEKTLNYFRQEMKEGDIVVTHHAPSTKSISEYWRGDECNRFFVNYEAEKIIAEKKPKLWIAGHMHSRFDYTIYNTRVIQNPLGYPREKTGFINTPFEI